MATPLPPGPATQDPATIGRNPANIPLPAPTPMPQEPYFPLWHDQMTRLKVGHSHNHCALCRDTGPLTDEDILPLWARSELFALFPPKPSQSRPARIKIRICQDCNRRMGRRFEATAAPILKPLLSGRSGSLGPDEQCVISYWAIKTILLLGIANLRKVGRNYERDRTRLIQLADGREPPNGTSVRMARYPAGPDGTEEGARLAEILPDGAPRGVENVGVFSLGYVAFEVVVANPDEMMRFISLTRGSDKLVRIWPIQLQAVSFPPPLVLARADLTAMQAAFDKHLVGGVTSRHSWGPGL